MESIVVQLQVVTVTVSSQMTDSTVTIAPTGNDAESIVLVSGPIIALART